MVRRRMIGIAVLLGFGAVLWFPLLSALMYAGLRIKHVFPAANPWHIPVAAYLLWRDYADLPAVAKLWKPCLIFATALCCAPAGFFLSIPMREIIRPARPGEKPPPPTRAASSSHGSADWMAMAEARKLFRGQHPIYGGIAIGEAYRVDLDTVAHLQLDLKDESTWGMGGRADMLIDDCTEGATHGTVEAGSGGFKTTAVTLPTLATWTGSIVVNDPPQQVGPMAAQMRRDMGHKVVFLHPGQDGIDALGWIDPADPLAETHVLEVVDWLAADAPEAAVGENSAFVQGGRKLIACLLADLIYDPEVPRSKKTLRELRARLRMPEDKLLGRLGDLAEDSRSALARDYASTLMKLYRKTFSGVYFNATGATDFLAVDLYASMVSDASFRPSDLCGGRLTAFLQIPEATMKSDPALGRVLLGAMRAAVRMAQGNLIGRVLFLLDEAKYFGRLEAIADIYTGDRKLGITCVTMWQDHADVKAIWKERAGMFSANSSWSLYAAVSDQETSERVSRECGRYTVIVRTQGTSSGVSGGAANSSRNKGQSEGTAEQSRPLILPEEVRLMRPDEAIILRRGAPPLRCGRPIYLRRDDLASLFADDRLRRAA